MSDRYFVDTNILMHAHDTAAGEKHRRAKALVEDLWETRAGVVSTQVLQELAVNLRRKTKKPLDAKATRDVVSDYLAWHVVVNGGDSIREALDLETSPLVQANARLARSDFPDFNDSNTLGEGQVKVGRLR